MVIDTNPEAYGFTEALVKNACAINVLDLPSFRTV
jgi:hypothetical protein